MPLHERPCGFLLQYCTAHLERLPAGEHADALWNTLQPFSLLYFDEQVRRVPQERANIQHCMDQLSKDSGHEGMYLETMAEVRGNDQHKDYVQSFSELERRVGPSPARQTSKDLFQIYKQGEAVHTQYNAFVAQLSSAVGSVFVEAPLKKLYRGLEKIGVRQKNRWDGETLTDVVRGTVVIPYAQEGR